MRDPVLWRCLFNGDQELTVGKIFQLHCEGTLGVPFEGNLKLELPKDVPSHSLVLLNVVKRDATSFDLNVTSYRAGKFKAPYLRVTDGNVQIESNELEWTVNSVLQKDSKPIPPQGPFDLAVPASLIYLCVTIVALLIFVAGFFFWRHRKKSALTADLEKYHSHLSPIRQFEMSLRTLRNKLVWGKELKSDQKKHLLDLLDEAIRTYFLRTLNIRTHKLNRKTLVRMILKSRNPKAGANPKDWIGYYKELEVSKSKADQLDPEAMLQMVDQANALIVRFENKERYK